MKLYHATSIENKESILQNGIEAKQTSKMTSVDFDGEQIEQEGVFFFDSMDTVDCYARDLISDPEIVVFEVEIDINDVIIDHEYGDGEAYFYDGAVTPDMITKVEDI